MKRTSVKDIHLEKEQNKRGNTVSCSSHCAVKASVKTCDSVLAAITEYYKKISVVILEKTNFDSMKNCE